MNKDYLYYISTLKSNNPIIVGSFYPLNIDDTPDELCTASDALNLVLDNISNGRLSVVADELDLYRKSILGVDIVNAKTEKPVISYTFNIDAKTTYYN